MESCQGKYVALALLVIAGMLPSRVAAASNDAFSDATSVEGAQVVFDGSVVGATLEVGEPFPGYSNSVWIRWMAPFSGRASLSNAIFTGVQPILVYTGGSLAGLQPVVLVGMGGSRHDFIAHSGEVYHLQIAGLAGAGDNYQIGLELSAPGTPTNDLFSAARRIGGNNINWNSSADLVWMGEASAELGEPSHLNGAPFKSVWWQWMAPVHGTLRISASVSFTTNAVLAVYQGSSVDALTLLGKGTGQLRIPVTGGRTYAFAVAVPVDVQGDAVISGTVGQEYDPRPVSGNLLREPSFEGVSPETSDYWHASGGIGGGRNERGGCDGLYWLTFAMHPLSLWQDIPTQPGKPYGIRFAMRASDEFTGGGGGDGLVGVQWDGNEVGVAVLPAAERGYWHWPEFRAVASNTTTRVTFVNLARNIEMDAFSVVALTAPPSIVVQPSPASVLAGGSVAFSVIVAGSSPLTYHWFFNQAPLPPQSNPGLLLQSVTPEQAGTYQVVVSNAFGMATSVPVSLKVETQAKPSIVWQPFGDTVTEGGVHRMSVVAVGEPPLSYQWTHQGIDLPGETNRILTLDPVSRDHEGTYSVRVRNAVGLTWSLDAMVRVTANAVAGGTILFRTYFFNAPQYNAPVQDVDGITRLSGSNFVAQLYGGPSLELLRPLGHPQPFRTDSLAGYILGSVVAIPNAPPESEVVLQVRAWDATKGSSYEEARGVGARFGKSDLLVMTLGGAEAPPLESRGLKSFSLQAGRSSLAVGNIELTGQLPDGELIWSHTGEPGYRYLIERSLEGFEWRPFRVITNQTSVATFTDSINPGGGVGFYRSRILD